MRRGFTMSPIPKYERFGFPQSTHRKIYWRKITIVC